MRDENYRPVSIEFDIALDGSNMPNDLGEFESAESATKFLGENVISLNQGLTVARHMDFKEKIEYREEYNDILENKVPLLERDLSKATHKFNEAKTELANAKEAVNAAVNESKGLAYEVKRGLKEINLDELYTSRIAYKGRYYFYTYIDGLLKLCLIRDIPESEKAELWNQMAGNETFIDDKFGGDEKSFEDVYEEEKNKLISKGSALDELVKDE